ncbi:hypothetical protein [Phaeocystidibacter marisrubri]|uniref:Uncharacterized protein n=1 Tax=Phaeocystidibacter marisrubri TaxID=1577780 RepID=A0A6L3ZHS2_9FLAO|nr:hypothetical protein [Phaeocystidibacter marisrubri]KAB2817542.1 hypothetical protein F8C82_03850 [Phaeocystidibacter marisrubri]
MKKSTLTMLGFFTAYCAVGQIDENRTRSYVDHPVLYIMPYGGYMMSFANSTDPLWQNNQLGEPFNAPDWDPYTDGYELNEQPTVQNVESSPVFGVEVGLRFDRLDQDETSTYLSVGFEYQRRSYTGYQQYDNGSVVGENYLRGTECKTTVRLNLNQTMDAIGFHMGLWYRFSDLGDRTVHFRSYKDGNLEYQERVYPYTVTSTSPAYSYSVNDEWFTSRSGVGFSLGVLFQPVEYARVFTRYEYSHIPTTMFSGGWFEFGRNGLDTHTLTIGVGVPIVL